MSGQHPFEGVVEKLLDGVDQYMLPPHQLAWNAQSLLCGVPPEMIACEEEPVLVEQGHAACRVARNRNDQKLRHDLLTVSPFNDPFRIRNRFDVRPMNQPFRAKVRGILLCIGHIVFMREEDVRDASLVFEGLDEMFEVTR